MTMVKQVVRSVALVVQHLQGTLELTQTPRGPPGIIKWAKNHVTTNINF